MSDETSTVLAIIGKVKRDEPPGGVELYLNVAEYHRVCELLRRGRDMETHIRATKNER